MPCSSSKLLIASGTDILYMDLLASPLCLPVMSRFTRFARHKFSAARHLKLFCTPDDGEGFLTPPSSVMSQGSSMETCDEGGGVLYLHGNHPTQVSCCQSYL